MSPDAEGNFRLSMLVPALPWEREPCACSGLCCVALVIPMSPEQLKERTAPDAEQIANMLTPLTRQEAIERYESFGGIPGTQFDGPEHFYRCKNFDEQSRLCTIYEDRPAMCHKFPYGETCRHGCDIKGEAYEPGEDRL